MWLTGAPTIVSERRLSFLCAQLGNRGRRRKVRVKTKSVGADHVAHKTSEPLIYSQPRSQGPKPRRWSSEDIALSAASLGLEVIQTFGAGDKTKTKVKEFPVCGSHTGIFLQTHSWETQGKRQVEPQAPRREREKLSSFSDLGGRRAEPREHP